MTEAGAKSDAKCPHCGCERLFGPGVINDDLGQRHNYYSCPRCHSLVLENRETGELVARAGTW